MFRDRWGDRRRKGEQEEEGVREMEINPTGGTSQGLQVRVGREHE